MKLQLQPLVPVLAAGLLASSAAGQSVFINDNFETDTSADYIIANDGSPDGTQTFAYDYIAAGIPLAPNSAPGDTGGLRLTANDTATYRSLLGPFVQLIPWSGASSLHNSGETLRVMRPDGTEADVVTYSDTGGWTNEADGAGGSLEWKGPGWDNALPEAWIGSNALGGSPGSDNSSWAD